MSESTKDQIGLNQTVAVIGGSHAASELIPSLRKHGWGGNIVLVSAESSLPYHRPPLSKAYYQGEMGIDKLLIKPEKSYLDAQATVHLNESVSKVDLEEKSLDLSSGERIHFDKLVMATGTRARLLPVEGADLPNIFTLRTLADVDAIKTTMPENGRLLIVGAGYIGLELAASAKKHGASVVVLETQDRVLQRVTSAVVSNFYQRIHQEHGIDLRLGASLERFEQVHDGTVAILGDGGSIEFDCAVVGIGVVPNSELASDAGLECDNGILVDEACRTSHPDVYAIGDVSNHPNPHYGIRVRLESVPNATDQARVAAASICGQEVVYDALPWFWSDQYDIKLQTAGLFQEHDQFVVRGDLESNKFAVFYLKDGEVIACDAINSPPDFMMSKRMISARTKPDVEQLADPEVALRSLM